MNYQSALNDMIGFVDRFLDLGESVGKAAQLSELVDLIQQDETIGNSEMFFIGPDGQEMKKTALGGLTEVCLPSFLLGIWHHVVVNRKDNTVGRETYNKWCPPAGGGPKVYSAHMGNGILGGLSIYSVDTKDDPVIEEPSLSVLARTETTIPRLPMLSVMSSRSSFCPECLLREHQS